LFREEEARIISSSCKRKKGVIVPYTEKYGMLPLIVSSSYNRQKKTGYSHALNEDEIL
jgi:hypothetical protein